MLEPKKVKYRRHHRGNRRGMASRGSHVAFGTYGLKAMESGWITARQIEASRIVISRVVRKIGKMWIRIFPDKPITAKPAETRMGKGKGSLDHWVSVIKPGRILFEIEGVDGVFLGSDFISVTKKKDEEWFSLKPSILGKIMEHYASGDEVLILSSIEKEEDNADESDTVQQIKKLLETRVRPAVAMDGGDIQFESFEDGIVTLLMKGACSGCPSSTATLKMGIENMLRHYIPEVQEVRASGM